MTKLEALKKAVEKLENGFPYNWYDVSACNCGLIVNACGVPHEVISKNVRDTYRYAIKNAENEPHCDITGLPFSVVQESLLNAGFSKKDIIELECLGNIMVLARMNVGHHVLSDGRTVIQDGAFDSQYNLIAYLKAWIELLESEQVTPPTVIDPEPIKPIIQEPKRGQPYHARIVKEVQISNGIVELEKHLN